MEVESALDPFDLAREKEIYRTSDLSVRFQSLQFHMVRC